MRQLIFVFIILIKAQSFGQNNCAISAGNDTAICGSSNFQLGLTGNVYDVFWSPSTGLSDVTIPNPIASLTQDITYIVTNKQLFETNLIVNGNFDAGNNNFTNDYVSDCPENPYGPDIGSWKEGAPNDGQFCVHSPMSFAFALGGWQTCADHTGNGGQIMYVNGDVITDAKIWCQTVPVDPGFDYQFSTWITSVFDGSPAKLQFSINSNLLGAPFQVEPGHMCEWIEFFEIWNSGLSTSAEICITNQNTASNGNDFALDDILFQKVCVDRDTISVEVKPFPTVDLGPDDQICPRTNFPISSGLGAGYTYLWSTGETTADIQVDQPGSYSVEVTSVDGCQGTDELSLQEVFPPNPEFRADSLVYCIYSDGPQQLDPQTQAQSFTWSNGSTNSTLLTELPGWYFVTASNGGACTAQDSILLIQRCNASVIYFPNAFTPNGDGRNEKYFAKGENIFNYDIKIYNRWGEMVFETTDYSIGWDGTYANLPVPEGVYVYKATYEAFNSETNVVEQKFAWGHLSLVR